MYLPIGLWGSLQSTWNSFCINLLTSKDFLSINIKKLDLVFMFVCLRAECWEFLHCTKNEVSHSRFLQ